MPAQAGGSFTLSNFLSYPTAQIEEPKIEDAGIRVGEIIAWRAWRLTKERLLQSSYMDHVWLPGVPMIATVTNLTNSNALSHGKGIFAFKEPGEFLHTVISDTLGPSTSCAIGRVALWGTVIEHEYGYRAEFARVHSIDALRGVSIFSYRKTLKALQEVYLQAYGGTLGSTQSHL